MFAFPGIRVTRINLRPLVPERTFASFNAITFLKEVERELLRSIRRNIRQEAFSPAAKKRLAKGFEVKLGKSSLTVIAKDPAFRPLLEGQRQEQMRWLVKAGTPIPIVTDSGELIFRSATPKSMKNGSWYHPGRKPTTVIERAKAEVREVMRQRAKQLLQRQLRDAMRRSQ
jgi:hypothetical protein